MNKLKQSFLSGLIFSGTIMLSFLAYGAWNNLSHVESTDTLTDTRWNEMVDRINELGNSKIPTGMVSAFYGEDCPTGWTKADGSGDEKKTDGTLGNLDLRGEFIRGWDNSRGIDTGRILGSWQDDQFRSHNHGGVFAPSGSSLGDSRQVNYSSMQGYTNYAGGTETRPRNIALLYCVKQ